MQSQQQIEQFRRMTPAQRLAIWAELTSFSFEIWLSGRSEEEITKRWQAWRTIHDASDESMLRALHGER